ncbi:hypothetical protein PMAYCL1PPCAC_01641, partial [Pristionchus mayeri]
ICEYFRDGDTVKITSMLKPLFGMEVYFTGLTMEQKELFFKELVRQVEEEPLFRNFPYQFCSFCDQCMFTARHIFMHIASPEHFSKSVNACAHYAEANEVLIKLVGRWRIDKLIEEEMEKVRIQREKWSSMSLEDPELRSATLNRIPSGAHLADFLQQQSANGCEMTRSDVFVVAVNLFTPGTDKRHGENTIRKLNEQIGSAKTSCFWCKVIFSNAAEYYTHLLTYFHLRNAETFDLNTLVINLQKRKIARLLPWPQLPSTTGTS